MTDRHARQAHRRATRVGSETRRARQPGPEACADAASGRGPQTEKAGARRGGPRPASDGQGSAWRRVLPAIALAAAAAFAAAAGLGLIPDDLHGVGASDRLSDGEKAERRDAFQRFTATRLFPLALVPVHEREKALATMDLSDADETALEDGLEAGLIELAWVTLIDNKAQDGDVVGFRSDHWPQVNVTARHQPSTFAIVYPPSGQVTATGVHDGGGGITVDIVTDGTRVSFPAMAVGESASLPVAPR